MSRISLSITAALASAIAFSPLAANAQTTPPASSIAAGTFFPQQTAELNLPLAVPVAATLGSSSSAAASAAFDASGSVITSPNPSAPPQISGGGARPFSGIAIAAKVGVAGVGFDVATPLVRRYLNLRSGASFFSYNTTLTEDNVNIAGALKFQNASTMVDWFPFHGKFRISGGVTSYNNTGLNASLAVPAGQSFTLGDTTYYSQPGNPITGTGAFVFGGNKVAPRFTIGFGNMLPEKGHFRLITELGFQYLSAPTVTYNVAGGGCTNDVNGVYTNCGPIPQSSVTAEQNELQSDLYDLRFFPVFSIGLSYKIH
jgi:hypothetical protein